MKNDMQIPNGRLIIKEINFNRVLLRNVLKHGNHQGMIALPRDLIGKKVYVVVEKPIGD